MRRRRWTVQAALAAVVLSGVMSGCGNDKEAGPEVRAVCGALRDGQWQELYVAAGEPDLDPDLAESARTVAVYGHISEGGIAADLGGLFTVAATEQAEIARATQALKTAWTACGKQDGSFPPEGDYRFDKSKAIVMLGAHNIWA